MLTGRCLLPFCPARAPAAAAQHALSLVGTDDEQTGEGGTGRRTLLGVFAAIALPACRSPPPSRRLDSSTSCCPRTVVLRRYWPPLAARHVRSHRPLGVSLAAAVALARLIQPSPFGRVSLAGSPPLSRRLGLSTSFSSVDRRAVVGVWRELCSRLPCIGLPWIDASSARGCRASARRGSASDASSARGCRASARRGSASDASSARGGRASARRLGGMWDRCGPLRGRSRGPITL